MNLAQALLAKGINLGRAEQHEEAIAAYDALLSMFVGDDESENQLPIAQALFNKATTLGLLGYIEEELACYDVLISSFKRNTALALQQQVAQASFNKAISLLQLERNEDALVAFSELSTLFQETNDAEIQSVLIQALINQTILLGQLQKANEGLAIADKVISDFKGSKIESIQSSLAEFTVVIIEFSLLSETKAQSMYRIQQADSILDNPLLIASNSTLQSIIKAIITFYHFTLQGCSAGDVLMAIRNLPQGCEFDCSFEDLADYLSGFTGEMATKIALFVRYFEEDKNLERLTSALAEQQSG